MNDNFTYTICILDNIDDEIFNINSPQQIKTLAIENENTLITIHSDQSGLIGLLRQLHQQGFVILNINRY